MTSAILVHHSFDGTWPFAADYFHKLWRQQGAVLFTRVEDDLAQPAGEVISEGHDLQRLVLLNIEITPHCLNKLPKLQEICIYGSTSPEVDLMLRERNIVRYQHDSEGYWGQSVSEFALALTLCGLRRIPQQHSQIQQNQSAWHYQPQDGKGRPSSRGQQFGDDPQFSHGTIQDKKVRIVGAGNIGSRFAHFTHTLGADVAIWDPFASEPAFHRSGARRECHLKALVEDAEIFAPMLPLTPKTEGLLTSTLINRLPKGCLVVLVTRAAICDMAAIRRRVLNDEISLAADVFDHEPLALDDPLMGRHNVVHTPHNAGRTENANRSWVQQLAQQFKPVKLDSP